MARQPADEGLLSAPRDHIEDPSITRLAEEAGHTDEVAAGRQRLGWREPLSLVIHPRLLPGIAP